MSSIDPRTEPSAAFALRLSADILTALVVTGVLSRAAAAILIDEALANILNSYPEHEDRLREIAGTVSTQVGLVALSAERAFKRDE
jgi:hypothetical protein